MNLKIELSLLLILLCLSNLRAQYSFNDEESNLIEQFTNLESEVIDVSELIQDKENLMQTRLAINQADYTQLNELNCLSQFQIQKLIEHIKTYGPIHSKYELQTIEGFDLSSIRLLLPYIKIKLQLREELKSHLKSSHQIRFATAYRPEKSEGYQRKDSVRFQGSPYKHNLSYDYQSGNQIFAGIHLEKDDGEPLSYLFASAYLQFKLNRICRQIIIGDQQLNLSQGLLMGSGLSLGKSASVMQILKNSNGAKPYKSYNETGFLRGLSLNLKPGKQADIFLFVASRNQDALLIVDSLSERVGSINSSGNYRNTKEQANKNNINSFVYGLYYQSRFRSLKFGFGILDLKKNRLPVIDETDVYKRFLFNEKHSLKAAFDYSLSYKQCLFFGELAQSNLNGLAHIHGLLISAGKKSDISLLFRSFNKGFDGQTSNAFSEYGGTQNEYGFYLGFSSRINRYWQINLYQDFVQSSWLRYRLNRPGFANEQFAELTYKKKNDLQLHFRLRNQGKMYNSSENSVIQSIEDHQKLSVRFQMEYEHKHLRLRCRMEQNIVSVGHHSHARGTLFYQDLQIKIIQKLKISLRYTVFDADDYNSRTFAFENNMPATYAISAYNGKGIRYYTLLQYHVNKDLQIWFRFARSRYEDKDEIGSGLDLVRQNHISDFNILLQWKIKNQ